MRLLIKGFLIGNAVHKFKHSFSRCFIDVQAETKFEFHWFLGVILRYVKLQTQDLSVLAEDSNL